MAKTQAPALRPLQEDERYAEAYRKHQEIHEEIQRIVQEIRRVQASVSERHLAIRDQARDVLGQGLAALDVTTQSLDDELKELRARGMVVVEAEKMAADQVRKERRRAGLEAARAVRSEATVIALERLECGASYVETMLAERDLRRRIQAAVYDDRLPSLGKTPWGLAAALQIHTALAGDALSLIRDGLATRKDVEDIVPEVLMNRWREQGWDKKVREAEERRKAGQG